MKKIVISSAIGALFAAATPLAFAQSSVTLYGIVDTGVQYYNNASGGGSVLK